MPPAGTRPDAIAPATAPMQYGTSTDEIAKIAPKSRRSDVRKTLLRNAKLEPRSTMPSAASVSGTNSVSVIDANASENPVQSTTRQKISQTWFASQTGPIEWSMSARGRSPALGAARDEVPEARAEVGAAEERVGGDADEQDDRDDVSLAHSARPRWASPRLGCAVHGRCVAAVRAGRRARRVSSSAVRLAEPPAHPPQHPARRSPRRAR